MERGEGKSPGDSKPSDLWVQAGSGLQGPGLERVTGSRLGVGYRVQDWRGLQGPGLEWVTESSPPPPPPRLGGGGVARSSPTY